MVDIHGKVPPTMDGTNLHLKDYLSGFNYKHNWGDAIQDFYDTQIFIFDLKTNVLGRVELPEDLKPAFPRWVDDDSICFTGYEGSSFLTGLKYCMNKPSGIYVMKDIVTKPILNFSDTPLAITQDLRGKFSVAPIKISGEDQLA